MKAPYNDNETKAADPIANPFPIAAVVFPAASKSSVFDLTSSPKLHISAIPPALSETGPQASIANPTAKVESIPKAPKAIPNIPNKVWQINDVIANNITGNTVDIFPKAIPQIILVAAPVVHDSANSLTGVYECDVYLSVINPINNPDHNPNKQQIQASQIVAYPESVNPYNLSGNVKYPAKYVAGVAKIVEKNN